MGLLLVYGFEPGWDASRFAYYGLLGMAHRGPWMEVAVLGEEGPWTGRVRVSLGGDGAPRLPRGWAVLAAVEPAAAIHRSGGVVLAVDGGCPPGRLLGLLARGDLGEAAEAAAGDSVYSPCSFAALTPDGGFLLARGLESRRPLTLGGYGFDALMAATESAPVTLMGGRRVYDLDAGEAVYGSRFWVERLRRGGTRRTSLFEYVYMARSDSVVDGVPVYLFRREMGRRLARHHEADVDLVVGVPETALPYAVGYAEEKGAKLELGFVSTLGRVRTAVAQFEGGAEERARVLSLKLNPVPGIYRGRRVAIVDDSVVTGLTLKTVIQRLRRLHGAVEVHVAVSSPRIVRGCPYRLQAVAEEGLIARHLDDERIARVLDADSLAWLPLGEAVSYLEERGISPCTHCMR